MSDDEIVRLLRERTEWAYVLTVEDGLFTVVQLTEAPLVDAKHVIRAATTNCPRDALANVLRRFRESE